MEFLVSVDKKTMQYLSRGFSLLSLMILPILFVMKYAGFIHVDGSEFFWIFFIIYFVSTSLFSKVRMSFDSDILTFVGVLPFPKLKVKISEIEQAWTKNTNLSTGKSLINIISKGSDSHVSGKKTIFIKHSKSKEPVQIKGRGQGTTDSIISYLYSYGVKVQENV